MTCVNCKLLIEEVLGEQNSIVEAKVDYVQGFADISYEESKIQINDIAETIKSLGYKVFFEKPRLSIPVIFAAVGAVLCITLLLKYISTTALFLSFPIAQEGMGYGVVFVIGLFTSLHCISMCGGINLSQTMTVKEKNPTPRQNGEQGRSPLQLEREKTMFSRMSLFIPSFLYNSGRVVSYTLTGAAVGSLGSIVAISDSFRQSILLLAGFFMLMMALSMLDIVPFFKRISLLFSATKKEKTNKSPFIIGFLNGFMPCGPLQAMQLYALSTSSPLWGGVAMFIFAAGTFPLMYLLGVAGSYIAGLKGNMFSKWVLNAGAVLIASMGLLMILNGLYGLGLGFDLQKSKGGFVPTIDAGEQIVRSDLLPNAYPNITVAKDIPVKWVITAPENSINGCNNRAFIREYGIEHTFVPGENVLSFIPEKTGKFNYSCWMSMIHGSITVVEMGQDVSLQNDRLSPEPAGYQIWSEEIAYAAVIDGSQYVEIDLGDEGFSPAIILALRDIPLYLSINILSADPANFRLLFPADKRIENTTMGKNTIELNPVTDFAFSTFDYVFFAYVKVVADLTDLDIESIEEEIFLYETLIYPLEYFLE